MKPSVSVIIPFKTRRPYLEEAIESVKSQTIGKNEYEIIISSGYTLGKNVNKGVSSAKGTWIKVLADDDLLPKTSLEDLVTGIQSLDWINTDAENFDERGVIWHHKGKNTTLIRMLERNEIHGGATLYRKDLWKRFGGWDGRLNCAEEYDFHLKLLKNGCSTRYHDRMTYRYRVHPQGKGMSYWAYRQEDEEMRRKWFDFKAKRAETIEMIKNRYR